MSSSQLTSPILVIDGLNFFTRHFVVNEMVSVTGTPVGGTTGFIRGLSNLIQQLRPEKVIVVWEQGGPSPRRRALYPAYKANRAKAHKDTYRADGKYIASSDPENKIFQLQTLSKALGFLPVCQVFVQDTEADDVIAYIVKCRFQSVPLTKIVVSNDKDFYQLLEDSSVRIYDPARKILIDSQYIQEKFGISPRNITLARAIIGDPSDNLDGVGGIGFKTVSSRFQDFSREDVDLNQEWLLEQCKEHSGAKKAPKCFGDIVEHSEVVSRNWKLMYLDTSCLSASQIAKVDYRLDAELPALNKFDYFKVFSKADIPISHEIESAFEASKTLVREFRVNF